MDVSEEKVDSSAEDEYMSVGQSSVIYSKDIPDPPDITSPVSPMRPMIDTEPLQAPIP